MYEKKHQEDYYLRVLFKKIKIEDIMSRDFETIRENDDCSKLERKFLEKGVNHVVVLDHNDKLIGLISQKYLYKTQSPRKKISQDLDYDPNILVDGDSFYSKDVLDSLILTNIMKKSPFALKQDDTIDKAIINMKQKNLAYIPVVNEVNEVIGAFSDREIVQLIASILTE